jgi:hypothetical protein
MAEAKQQPQAAAATSGVWKTVKPFVNGGASGMLATCVIQPIDMVKVNPYAARPVFFFASCLLPCELGCRDRFRKWLAIVDLQEWWMISATAYGLDLIEWCWPWLMSGCI